MKYDFLSALAVLQTMENTKRKLQHTVDALNTVTERLSYMNQEVLDEEILYLRREIQTLAEQTATFDGLKKALEQINTVYGKSEENSVCLAQSRIARPEAAVVEISWIPEEIRSLFVETNNHGGTV